MSDDMVYRVICLCEESRYHMRTVHWKPCAEGTREEAVDEALALLAEKGETVNRCYMTAWKVDSLQYESMKKPYARLNFVVDGPWL